MTTLTAVLLFSLLLVTVLSAGTIAALIGSSNSGPKQRAKHIEEQKKMIDESLSNYRQEQFLVIERDVQSKTKDVWNAVQSARRDSYAEIADIKIAIEKERNVLNILKSEKITFEALMVQKDREIERLSDILKRAVVPAGSKL